MIDVVCAILQKDDCFLLARRKQGGSLAGYWEFPGGKVEPGETPEQALYRELKEELAIETVVGEHIDDSVFDYKDKLICLKGYLTEYVSGEFELDSHDEIVWVPAQELLNYQLAPADVPLVKQLFTRLAVLHNGYASS